MKKTKKAYEIVIDSIKEQIMNQELVLGQGLPPVSYTHLTLSTILLV